MKYVSPPNAGVIKTEFSATPSGAPKTLIVSGVARSGTSMVSSVLLAAGINMGDNVYDVVQEDAEILAILQSGHNTLLRGLIEKRNAEHATWGFKIPNLHAYMTVEQIQWFRNPHMILICRDPVAVAVRGALSEHLDEMEGLIASTNALVSVAEFAARVQCPTLLLSYEKAITAPERMLESLMTFCGIEPTEALFEELLRVVLPNNPAYLQTANRQFLGFVEGILDGKIYGWCHQAGSLVPVPLDLFADDVLLTSFQADQYRVDLADSQIGNGNHGFYVDVSRYGLRPDAVLRIKLRKRTIELQGSGRTVRELSADQTEPTPEPQINPALAPATDPSLAGAR